MVCRRVKFLELFLIFLFLVGLSSAVGAATWEVEKVIDQVNQEPPYLDYPVFAAVHPQDGTLVISDWGNNRLLIMDEAGDLIKVISDLASPVGLAFSPQGEKLYVVEQEANQVRVFRWGDYSSISVIRPEKTSFNQPRGIWVDSEGKIYVVDTDNSRIVVFGPDEKEIFSFGKEGIGNDEFYYPRGIAVDLEGRIWVADTIHHCIKVFDSQGKFLFRFGQAGEKAEDFDRPRYLFTTKDYVFISDYNNHRLKVYDLEGNLVEVFGEQGRSPGSFSFPEGVWVDQNGFLWVADAGNNRIQKFRIMSLTQPVEFLAEMLSQGEVAQFFESIDRLSLEERERPEIKKMIYRAYQVKGDIEGMIAQAEDLYLNEAAERDQWKSELGRLYYQKALNLKAQGRVEEARNLFHRSFQFGNRGALFPYLWNSFLLISGSNLMLIILGVLLVILLLVFYRIKNLRNRRW